MNKKLPEQSNAEEVDLGQLFKLIGNAFTRLFRFIGNILNGLFLAFVWLVFFFKKHALKIVIAGLLGIGFGYYNQKTSHPVYKSSIVIKQNYATGESLNSLIASYNDLMNERDSMALSNNLRITPTEASGLVKLKLEANLDDNQKLQLFDNYTKELDSITALNLDFENYLANANDYNYQLQKITLRAKTKSIFEKVFLAVIDNVESSLYFQNEQKKDLDQLRRNEHVIRESLKESDSLQKVYQLVLEKSVEKIAGGQTNVTIDNTEDKSITKEFELFNKDLELRRELTDIERRKQDLEYIIEIISTEDYVGTLDNKKEMFGYLFGPKAFYGLSLSLVLIVALLALEFLRFLERFRNKI